MVSKDQVKGGALLVVCVIAIIVYLILVADPGLFNLNANTVRLDAVLVLVSIAFIAALTMGAWIAWTNRNDAPKSIEEKSQAHATRFVIKFS